EKNALDFPFFLDAVLPPAVRELDGLQRLDEQSRATARLVVHDAADTAAKVGFDREHVAPRAHRDDRLLQRLMDRGTCDKLVQAPHEPIVGGPQLQSDAAQPLTGAVQDSSLVVESFSNCILQVRQVRYAAGNSGQHRRLDLLAQEEVFYRAAGGECGSDFEQIGGLKETTYRGSARMGGNVTRSPHSRVRPYFQ